MQRKLYDKSSTKEKRTILRENQTKAEEIMWEILRNRKFLGLKFRRQHGIGEYITDFYCSEKKIVIEIDGDTHFNDNAVEYDRIRTEFFNLVGIKVIRFTNNEVYQNIKEVLEEIERETYPHPSPLPAKERGL